MSVLKFGVLVAKTETRLDVLICSTVYCIFAVSSVELVISLISL